MFRTSRALQSHLGRVGGLWNIQETPHGSVSGNTTGISIIGLEKVTHNIEW